MLQSLVFGRAYPCTLSSPSRPEWQFFQLLSVHPLRRRMRLRGTAAERLGDPCRNGNSKRHYREHLIPGLNIWTLGYLIPKSVPVSQFCKILL